MAPTALSRVDLRRYVVGRLGYRYTGLLTTASATVPADTVRRTEPDSSFKGGHLFMTSGAKIREYARITGFTSGGASFATTGESANWGAQAVGDGYIAYWPYDKDELDEALYQAAREIYQQILIPVVVDATTAVVADTDEYTIPSGFNLITNVGYQDRVVSARYHDLPTTFWRVLPDPSTPKIRFDPDATGAPVPGFDTTQHFRFEGYAYYAPLTDDTTTSVYTPVNFVVPYACAVLLESRDKGKYDPYDRHALVEIYYQQAEAARQRLSPTTLVNNAVWVRP